MPIAGRMEPAPAPHNAARLTAEVDDALSRAAHPRAWSRQLRQSYDADRIDRHLAEIRYLLVAGILVAFASSLIDLAHGAEIAARGFELRLALVLPVALVGLILTQKGRVWPGIVAMCLSQMLYSLIVLHLSFMLPEVTGSRYVMAVAIILGLSNLLFPLRMSELLVYNAIYVAAQFALVFMETNGQWISQFDYLAIMVGISLGTLTLAERVERLQARNYLLRMQHQFAAEELLHTNRVLEEMSNRDPLTGLPNRRFFDSQFDDFVRETDRRFALVLFDLDHFKQINDVHGHQAGDRCLREAANVIQSVIGAHRGVLARFGGEEFIAVIAERRDGEGLHVAEAVRYAIESLEIRHLRSGDSQRLSLTISAGVALSGHPQYNRLETLIETADSALYEAKESGRNQVVVAEMPKLLRHPAAA